MVNWCEQQAMCWKEGMHDKVMQIYCQENVDMHQNLMCIVCIMQNIIATLTHQQWTTILQEIKVPRAHNTLWHLMANHSLHTHCEDASMFGVGPPHNERRP